MATAYPQGSFLPAIFSDSSPDTSRANLDLHSGALNFYDFTSDAAGATTLFLTFVIFDYPNAANAAQPAPARPVVEMLMVAAGSLPPNFDAAGVVLADTAITGTQAFAVPGGSVNYTYTSLGGGVFQITFTTDDVAFNALQWHIRFTVTDGATNAMHQKGLTFVVDSAKTTQPWIAVPGQLNLSATGPAPFDFAAALQGLTLSGLSTSSTKQLIDDRIYTLLIPVGNYGTAPLTISGVTPSAATNGFTLQLLGSLTIAPGSTDALTLQATFAAPAAGQTGSAASATKFTLASTDPANTHFSTVSLYATAGDLEIALVLDLSGSMATVDAGPMSRWAALQAAVGQVGAQLLNFATGPNDRFAAIVYPSANGNSVGQIVLPAGALTQANINKLVESLAGFTPTDSTPMAGTNAGPGGIYVACGHPANPATDCGVFLPSTDPGFGRNFRWMVLMSDGMSNVGDDPKTISPAYFTSRRIGAITVGYGKPNGGQVDFGTLKAIANESLGSAAANPANFFTSDPSGLPSQQITTAFEKSVASSLGLQFAADPDGILEPGAVDSRHSVVITEYDQSASFMVCVTSGSDAEALQVALLTPLGELISADAAARFAIRFSQAPLSRTYFADAEALANRGQTPRTGTWTIIVSRSSAPPPSVTGGAAVAGTSPLPYAYSVSVTSDLSLSVAAASPTTYAGAEIGIVAALALHGRPITGATVTATIAGAGQDFDNWLAAQTVTQFEYTEALRSLGGLHDVQALFVKLTALAAKNIVFPGTGSRLAQTLTFDPRTGTYRTSFAGTTQPGNYQFLITATGQDTKGNAFTRQQTWQTAVTPLPDAASTLVSISYQLVGAQMQATLQVWPKDRFGNVLLTDPAISTAIKVLLAGGATAAGPLKWNLDDSYIQVFTYPLTATPVVTVVAGAGSIATLTPPDFGHMRFVDKVIRFTKGREAAPGANKHVDPTQALGDPSRKPVANFVSLGGKGAATFAFTNGAVTAKQVTVFIAPNAGLRAYAVFVLPAQAGVGWIEVGRSRGVTQSFSLVPAPHKPPSTEGWYIEVAGNLGGETFDAKIPLAGRLHPPFDPLTRIGSGGITQVMVADLSNIVTDPGGTPSASPGVSVQAIGVTS